MRTQPLPLFFIIDVESIGLHGEAFAVAGGIYSHDGKTIPQSEFCFSCPTASARGEDSDRKWVGENVHPLEATHASPQEMRDAFWKLWTSAKDQHPTLVMAGECIWPVEAGFLSACVNDDKESRTWSGPYPFHDISSIMLSAGMDVMATYPRQEDEIPAHHPMADVRLSARLLSSALLISSTQRLSASLSDQRPTD